MVDIEDKVPRNPKAAIPILIVWAIAILYMMFSRGLEGVSLVLFVLLTAPLIGIVYLILSYNGEGSKLYGLRDLCDRLPAVKRPEDKVHVHFKTKMIWVIAILVIYFILTNVFIYGLDQEETIDLFAAYRTILAGAQGSLMHLGIGPIVTASIIMQLFVGAKIINLDLSKEDDKATYQGVQKLLVIIMIFVEAIPQVYGYLVPAAAFEMNLDGIWSGQGVFLARSIIIIQLFIGSYLVFLMDETISKWGIGSGISLFIAAGVSQSLFTGTLNWMPIDKSLPLSISNPPAGAIPKTFYTLTHSSASDLAGGGLESLILAPPNPLVALVGTLGIFLLVAYVESTRLEIPLAHESGRGARGRYPIRLIYASNIPVILMAALLANVSMFSMLLWSHPTMKNLPLIGSKWWIGAYDAETNELIAGGAWYLQSPQGLHQWLLPLSSERYRMAYMPHHDTGQIVVWLVIYVLVMIIGSVMFARFWIETTNMGSKDVAKQIQSSGMRIPGFRREPKSMEKVLDKYIPVVTVISGAFVGGLAAGADLIGTVGGASGIGVLLAVSILIQFYEAMAKEEMMEMHPMLRGFFGEE